MDSGDREGYSQGYAEGMTNAMDNFNIVYTYHEHEGSEGTEANGCYTTANNILTGYGTHNLRATNEYYDVHMWMECIYCGGRWLNCNIPQYYNPTCDKQPQYNTTYTLGCGKTEETIESVTIIY